MRDYNFKEAGCNITIYEPVTFIRPEYMILRSNIIVSEYAYVAAGLGLHMGNYVHVGTHSSVIGGGVCILEDFVQVCAGARLITGSDDIDGEGIASSIVPEKYRSFFRSYVHCRRHSFIATNAVVLPGITIGEGTVVGSGSVVTDNLEPWCVYAGNPAQQVKKRPKEKILELEKALYSENNIEMSDVSYYETMIRELRQEKY